MKIMIIALLLFGLSFPVTVKAATTQRTEPVVTKMDAQIQVGNQESQIKFWQTDNPQERHTTLVGLTALIIVGLGATWARRRFY